MGKTKARSETTESAASNQMRPVSRASTTSIHTISEPSHTHSRNVSESTAPALAYIAAQQASHDHDGRMRERLENGLTTNTIDPSLQEAVAAGAVEYSDFFSQDQSHNDPSTFSNKEDTPFTGASVERNPDGNGMADPQRKKGSNTSIANDQELRRVYHENKHRSLRDIADSVLAEERGPRSEKTKQIFAMVWLSTFCHKGEGSVPRNRVFTYYADKCGNERVPTLNPASFGKLVRIIFPGIQTRRLGMRGESKYHYVDLEMKENVPEDIQHDMSAQSGPDGRLDEKSMLRRQRNQLHADTAVFPHSETATTGLPRSKQPNIDSQGCLFLNSKLPGLHKGPSRPNMVNRELRFPSRLERVENNDEAIQLPSLQEYLPSGTDPDSVAALKALYRAHCIAVIDAFRYCKEKVFYHAFTSFHGTLTVPVQKLLAHSNLAPWIKECDCIMYQKMIGYVSHLALQVMPVKVLDTLRTISSRLCQHILNTFQNHPSHVRDARHGPAVIFTSLLDRLLRVNTTAHAAANLLTDSTIRNQMWLDWALFVRPTHVVETCLPGRGYVRTLQILTNEIRELLGPLSMILFDGMQPIFQETASLYAANDRHQVEHQPDSEGILDRWNDFLLSLPSRFPDVDARTLIDYIGQIGSAALRDLTVADARSFGAWWVTKTWIDEMLLWHAERGGFLERVPHDPQPDRLKRSAYAAGFDAEEENVFDDGARQRTSYEGSLGRSDYYHSPQIMQNFNTLGQNNLNTAREERHPPQTNPSDTGPHTKPPNFYSHQSGIGGGFDRQSTHTVHTEFTPTGIIIRNGEYSEHLSSLTGEHQASLAVTQDGHGSHRVANTKNQRSYSKSHSNKPIPKMMELSGSKDLPHDDSGIGLDLDLPMGQDQRSPTRLADYGSFVGANATASDPADVVVC